MGTSMHIGNCQTKLLILIAIFTLLIAASVGAKPLPSGWPLGQRRDYVYLVDDKVVGEQKNVLLPAEDNLYKLMSQLSIDLTPMGEELRIEAEAILYVDKNALPVSYTIKSKGDILRAKFDEKFAHIKITRGKDTQEIKIPWSRRHYVVDNLFAGHLALLFSVLELKEGKAYRTTFIVPQELAVINTRTSVVAVQKNCGKTIFLCNISPIGEKVWVEDTGRLVRLTIPEHNILVRIKEGNYSSSSSSQPSSRDVPPPPPGVAKTK